MPTPAERRRAFRRLHDQGCFVVPSPWDVGTARYLQHVGFKALGTTGSGFAYSAGLVDGAVPLDLLLRHLHDVVAATRIPVNADFEGGFSAELDGLSTNVRRCIGTGIAGITIEDAFGSPTAPVLPLDVAVKRLKAVRACIDQSGFDVFLTGRTNRFLHDSSDIDAVIRRLIAYAEAGADCLYAPGVQKREHIVAVVNAVAPKPVNVLMRAATGLTVADLGELGVRRVSIGGGLARVAWTAFMRAAETVAKDGRFDALADALPHLKLSAFLGGSDNPPG